MKFKFLGALFCAAMLTGGLAHAQDTNKIGFVNLDRILRDAAPAQRAQKKIEAEFSSRDKELAKQSDQVKRMQAALEKNSVTLSDTERTRREHELRDATREFQRKQREFREDLNQRRNEELAAVLERANRAVRQIAESEKYDIIFQEAVYANPRIDITDKVVRALDDSKTQSK